MYLLKVNSYNSDKVTPYLNPVTNSCLKITLAHESWRSGPTRKKAKEFHWPVKQASSSAKTDLP